MLWQKNLRNEKIKTYLLPFWLTDCSKNVNILGKNIFLIKFPSEGFKILEERKKCSFLSLRHARISLASGKLLWFPIGLHQRSKLNLSIQIQTPWTEKHLCLLPSLWGADNPQAPQKSWDYSVFLWLEDHCSLPPASLACFTLKSISTKGTTGTPSPQKQQQMWNPEVKDQHNCKHSLQGQS